MSRQRAGPDTLRSLRRIGAGNWLAQGGPFGMGSRRMLSGERVGSTRHRKSFLGRVLRQQQAAVFGATVVFVAMVVAVAAPWISPSSAFTMDPVQRLAPPGTSGHLLGMDGVGRDILSRMIWGSRISLLVGLVPLVVAGTIGVAMGLIAGYAGGRVDNLAMRVVDVLLAFPAILLAIAIVAVLGPGLFNAMLATTVIAIPNFARLTRGSVLAVKENLYVEAARCVGAGPLRIVGRHILPNVASPLIVFSTLEMGRLIVFAASLSFLGLGVEPPTPEWGSMLSEGRQVLNVAPHVAMVPGLAIFLVTLGLNLLGDGLRDILDPRLRSRG